VNTPKAPPRLQIHRQKKKVFLSATIEASSYGIENFQKKYCKHSKQDDASLLRKMLQTTQTPMRGWRISKIKILLLSTGHDGAEQAAMSQRPSQGAARF
jgi:hypothetical protein